MILLDIGYLIALADPTDAFYARAKLWSRSFHESVVVTEYVLVEMIDYFSKPNDRSRGHDLLDLLLKAPDCEFVHADPDLFHADLTLHRARPDKAWSLTDCISFHLMRERGIQQALAYDHHFEQAGFDPLLRRDPSP